MGLTAGIVDVRTLVIDAHGALELHLAGLIRCPEDSDAAHARVRVAIGVTAAFPLDAARSPNPKARDADVVPAIRVGFAGGLYAVVVA
jgi:hypothetical protein